MAATTYNYAVGRIKALEPKLLGKDRIDRMVDANSPQDVLKILSETDYAIAVSELKTPYEYEDMLSRELKGVYDLMQSISPNPDLTQLFFINQDIHNVKVILKSKYLKMENPEPLMGVSTVPIDNIKKAIDDNDYRDLPNYIAGALEILENMLSTKVDPQKIDVVLDKAMYRHIFCICRDQKDEFVKGYFEKKVDLVNIKTLLRVKRIGNGAEFLRHLLLPGGILNEDFFVQALDQPSEWLMNELKNSEYERVIIPGVQQFAKQGSLTLYERLADDYLMDYIKAKKWESFGIAPIVAYILAKQNEIDLIRIIMVGKINNIPADKISERLRDTYA
ncbi:MAG: V-type ATP synthase subunit C [Xylanivirga thermophila]|jgi:V/A-type H+/Na+-transporting ATPase subunit C|uniref:V-type ATP synthase subunit C n=1 Tax=Xylanivirga thermophila TaxID=2496273 RepID=UPI0039F624CE